METHNCSESRELGAGVTLQTWTHRVGVIVQEDTGPDDVGHGAVPILRASRTRHNPEVFLNHVRRRTKQTLSSGYIS